VGGLKVQHFTVHAAGESIVANVNRRWGIVMAAIQDLVSPNLLIISRGRVWIEDVMARAAATSRQSGDC